MIPPLYLGSGTVLILLGVAMIVYALYKKRHAKEYKSEALKKFLNIEQIKDNTVILSDSSLHAVIELKGSRKVRELTHFLTSLYYPVQLVIRPVNLNVVNKIQLMKDELSYNLKQEDKEALVKKLEAFADWLLSQSKKSCKTEKKVYLVVSYLSANSYLKNLFQLNARMADVEKGMKAAGYHPQRLNNQDLITLYHSYLLDSFYTKEEGYLSYLEWLKKYIE